MVAVVDLQVNVAGGVGEERFDGKKAASGRFDLIPAFPGGQVLRVKSLEFDDAPVDYGGLEFEAEIVVA